MSKPVGFAQLSPEQQKKWGTSENYMANWKDPMLSQWQNTPKGGNQTNSLLGETLAPKLGFDGKPITAADMPKYEGKPFYTPPVTGDSAVNGQPKLGFDGKPVNPIVSSAGLDYVSGTAPQDNPFSQQLTGFGKTIGGYGEQIGGFGDKLGGFGEQLGGFGNQITGFNEQFSNINNKLQNMEEGITSLTNKLNNKQQTQSSQPYSNPYQGLQSMLYGNYGGYQSPFTNNYSFY